jgi:hypothetical protein
MLQESSHFIVYCGRVAAQRSLNYYFIRDGPYLCTGNVGI